MYSTMMTRTTCVLLRSLRPVVISELLSEPVKRGGTFSLLHCRVAIYLQGYTDGLPMRFTVHFTLSYNKVTNC